jgi:ribosome-binding factor A
LKKQRRILRRASERDGSSLAARGAGLRSQRLEELFREELNSVLDVEVSDPALDGVRFTRVELSGDGSRARAWFAVAALDANPARAALEHAGRFLRSRLCDALPVKRIPDLTFRHDPAAQLPEEEP